MVMRPDILGRAIKANCSGEKILVMSPKGKPLTQDMVKKYAQSEQISIVCGRFEGIDERVLQKEVDLEVSVGDYVLSGGELPAMCIIDAVSRMVPGVLGNIQNAQEDSFAQGLLHFPQYTRPEEIDGMRVPEVLMSGNHEKIRNWRLQQCLGRTYERRPDLLKNRELTKLERKLLDEYLQEHDLK